MKCRYLLKPYHPVKLCKNIIIMVHNVVSRIIYMASIKADSQPFLPVHSIIDCLKLLEGTAYFTALSCHRLKCDKHIVIILIEHCVKSLYNLCDSSLLTGIYMTSRMKHQYAALHCRGPYYLLFQKLHCQLVCLRLYCVCQIYDVWRVDHYLIYPMLMCIFPACVYVELKDFLSSRVLWCPGVEHKHIRAI